MFIKSQDERLLNFRFVAEIFMRGSADQWAVYAVTVYPTYTDEIQLTKYMKQEDAEKEFDRLEKLLVKE
jgi:hypothetical protein